jgi:hypothetical protein
MHEPSASLGVAVFMLTRSSFRVQSGEVRKAERTSGLEHPLSDRSCGNLYLFCVVGFLE